MDVFCRLAEQERLRRHETLLRQIAAAPPATPGRRGRLLAVCSWRSRPSPVSDDASLEWRARPLRTELRQLLRARA
jgi:hypothetical protein